MKFKNLLLIVSVSASTAVASVWGYGKWQDSQNQHATAQYNEIQQPGKIPANYASFTEDVPEKYGPGGVDFTAAAAASTPAVVHIKTKINARTVSNGGTQRRNPFADLFGGDDDMFGDIFGNRGGSQVIPEQRASGSGVIVTDDGYIVTNNHVIENANEINVTLNNKQIYKAQLVGADPQSDLAVLKINATKLPYMLLGNSDEVKLGQWVLAIGYPLTLDVTVTAGIVSAKARYLGINGRRRSQNAQGAAISPIESFIQTDAAVNPGNSGGALVDTDGKLIGINSAIASPTGSYAGYSYAIPVNIVKKIVGDLKKFGAVQRAYLGINYANEALSDEQKKEQGIIEGEGVYVMGVSSDGAAQAAGIRKGDIVTAVNGIPVFSSAEMVGQVANYKPGDKITLTYKRNGTENTVNLALKNNSGNFDIVKGGTGTDLNGRLGAELETYDKKKAVQAGITGGILVKKIGSGVLKTSKMQDGFVITGVNGANVTSVEELSKALNSATGIIRLEGVYPGFEGTYAFPLNLADNDSDQ